MTIKVALLGLGTVGGGVYEAVQSHQHDLQSLFGKPVEVTGILVKNSNKPRRTDGPILISTKIEDILSIPGLDLAVEAIGGCEPAKTYITRLFEKGVNVVSANKELIAHSGQTLKRIAKQNRVTFRYEAAVAGSIPVIRTLQQLLRVNRVEKIEAILNGTSNFILTRMRQDGLSFEEALALAQREGYAEANPANDIEGRDSFYKIMILSQLLYGRQPLWENVDISGISHLTTRDFADVETKGKRLKLIAALEKGDNTVTASVKPVAVSKDHPLYHVEGVDNAVCIKADLAGDLLLQGAGAGAKPTASAIIEDLAEILLKLQKDRRTLYAAR